MVKFSNKMLRYASNHDIKTIIQLIDLVFQEYGDRVYLEGAESDLTDIEKNFFAAGGAFWLYEVNNQPVATVAVLPKDNHTAELKRVYLAAAYRGVGIADELLQQVISWCRERQIGKLFFWSDTRFTRAHAFYEKRGFRRGTKRDMTDGNMPYSEIYFEKIIENV